MVNSARLGLMAPGSYLVNVARGPLVDEHALVQALEIGHFVPPRWTSSRTNRLPPTIDCVASRSACSARTTARTRAKACCEPAGKPSTTSWPAWRANDAGGSRHRRRQRDRRGGLRPFRSPMAGRSLRSIAAHGSAWRGSAGSRRRGDRDIAPRNAAASRCACEQRRPPTIQASAGNQHPGVGSLLAVNLRAPFLCIRSLSRQLIATRGSIVNVSSVHATATSVSMAAHAASKGGLAAFTRAAALELAAHGVRVNAVAPGAVETPALRESLDRRPGVERAVLERTPLGRFGQPDEIAEAVAFLLDGRRSGFMTGQCIVIDGGATARLSSE